MMTAKRSVPNATVDPETDLIERLRRIPSGTACNTAALPQTPEYLGQEEGKDSIEIGLLLFGITHCAASARVAGLTESSPDSGNNLGAVVGVRSAVRVRQDPGHAHSALVQPDPMAHALCRRFLLHGIRHAGSAKYAVPPANAAVFAPTTVSCQRCHAPAPKEKRQNKDKKNE